MERRRPARVFAYVAAGLHLTIAPLVLALSSVGGALAAHAVDASGPDLPWPRDLVGKTVVVVHAQSLLFAGYRFGLPRDDVALTPKEMRVLSAGTGDRTVTRIDARTLEIRSPTGLVNGTIAGVFCPAPPRAGQSYRLSDLLVATSDDGDDGAARTGTFRFDRPLDDGDDRVWLTWDRGRFVRFAPPKVGESVVLRD